MLSVDISRAQLFRKGSVQVLYKPEEFPELLLCEISRRCSIFDIGSFLEIPGSDLTRALMRHDIFCALENPERWKQLKKSMESPHFDSSEYQMLCREGLKTHHRGILDKANQKFITSKIPIDPGNFLLAKRFEVYEPELISGNMEFVYDYSVFKNKKNFVIPLEMICRLGMPENSSLAKIYRAADKAQKQQLARKAGEDSLNEWQEFKNPYIEFTSKFESVDRHLSGQEAMHIFSICGSDYPQYLTRLRLIAIFLQDYFRRLSLTLWDFKLEFAEESGRAVLVDTIDLDSCRVTYEFATEGRNARCHINKQSIRDYFIRHRSEWLNRIFKLKHECSEKGLDFKTEFWKKEKTEAEFAIPETNERFLHLQSMKQILIFEFLKKEIPQDIYEKRLEEISESEVEWM